ncbi:MAG: hypothetical protein ABIR38_09225 [Chthoniobacterales bacterium]
MSEVPPAFGVIVWRAEPAFDGALSKDQLWRVSLLLRNADKLPALVQDMLRQ